jgi:hypothetical protein
MKAGIFSQSYGLLILYDTTWSLLELIIVCSLTTHSAYRPNTFDVDHYGRHCRLLTIASTYLNLYLGLARLLHLHHVAGGALPELTLEHALCLLIVAGRACESKHVHE